MAGWGQSPTPLHLLGPRPARRDAPLPHLRMVLVVSLAEQAQALRDDLRALGLDTEVTPAPSGDLEVVTRAILPLGLEPGRPSAGTTLTFSQRISPWLARPGQGTAEYLAERFKREVTMALLKGLLPVAAELGVHRQALAPFAREVVGFTTERAFRLGDPAADRVRYLAMPFTDADGRGR